MPSFSRCQTLPPPPRLLRAFFCRASCKAKACLCRLIIFCSAPLLFAGPAAALAGPVIIDKASLRMQADSLFLQGRDAFLNGREEEALRLFQKVLLFHPDSSAVREISADIYQSRGLSSQAFLQYQIILKKDPENQAVRLKSARLLREASFYEEALSEHRFLLQRNPRNFEAGKERALALKESGDFKAALAQWDQTALGASRERRLKILFQKADTARAMKDPTLQRKILRQIIALNPQSEESARQILGCSLDLNDLEGAGAWLLKLQRQREDLVFPAKLLSKAIFTLHDPALLFRQLKKLQQFDELTPLQTFQLAGLWMEKDRPGKALPLLRDLLQMPSVAPLARYSLGFFHERRGSSEEAKKHYRLIPIQSPYGLPARRRLADILQSQGRRQEALSVLQDISKSLPRRAESFFLPPPPPSA